MSLTVLYARVSTTEQTAAHQQAQAREAGFAIDEVVTDEGVSGLSTKLAERPGGKRLFDMLRSGDILVVRWVDRLGRDYQDVTDAIRALMRKGVIVRTVINGMTFDGATSDPVQQAVRDALIAFMAATAQAQAEATKAAQRVGIANAKASKGDRAYRGRKPSFTRVQFEQLRAMVSMGGHSDGAIAKATGIARNTVFNVRRDMAKYEAALSRWGM